MCIDKRYNILFLIKIILTKNKSKLLQSWRDNNFCPCDKLPVTQSSWDFTPDLTESLNASKLHAG